MPMGAQDIFTGVTIGFRKQNLTLRSFFPENPAFFWFGLSIMSNVFGPSNKKNTNFNDQTVSIKAYGYLYLIGAVASILRHRIISMNSDE